MAGPAEHERGPRTVVVRRIVHPGREREFEDWAKRLEATAQGFEGHLGNTRLLEPGGVNYLLYYFDSPEHLRTWEESPERKRLSELGDTLSDRHEEQRRVAVGMDAWFAVPGQSASAKWKTFVVTWMSVYPTLLVITRVFTLFASGWWWPLRLALSSLVLVAALTWLIMPRVSTLFRRWLLRGASEISTRPKNSSPAAH